MREIAQCRRIRVVDPGCLFQEASGPLPLLGMHVLQRKQLIGTHKFRILADHLAKLHQSHVFITLFQIGQALIVFADRSIILVQPHLGALQRLDIGRGKIVPAVHVIADDPLHERVDHLSRFKVAQPQQIPRVGILFIEFQGSLQAGNRAGQVSDLGLFQSLVIQKV